MIQQLIEQCQKKIKIIENFETLKTVIFLEGAGPRLTYYTEGAFSIPLMTFCSPPLFSVRGINTRL